MKVFSWEQIISSNISGPSAVSIGGFDGMHLGHCRLFDEVFDYKARHPQVLAGAVTFSRPPALFKAGRNSCDFYSGDVSTPKLKLDFFKEKGFDFCIMIDFSLNFSKIKGRDFLDIVRKFCSMQFLAAGLDFRLGHNSDTGVAELSDYCTGNGLELKVLDDVVIHEKRVSSSLVRGAVLNSDFDFAGMLLGRPYCLDGSVLDFKPERSSSGAGLSVIADRKTTQVLPEKGSFPVNVVFAGENGCLQNGDAVLHVESSFLRLEFPLGQKFFQIEKIEFI